MERGEDALALASGVAALHAVYFTFHRDRRPHSGLRHHHEAHVEALDTAAARKYGIEATFVDVTDLDAVRAAIPAGHPDDHRRVSPIHHQGRRCGGAGPHRPRRGCTAGDRLDVHPSAAVPAAGDGADLVIHSLTKYINGHGDAMGGAVIGAAALVGRVKPRRWSMWAGDLTVQRMADLPRVDHVAAAPGSASGHPR